ncbi:MAG: carbohydrate ABC transporter substrate-binding protein [Treponema sp.]|nr:carbohydrate ABC transporter substrate-binding protein [Treponema sp.]
MKKILVAALAISALLVGCSKKEATSAKPAEKKTLNVWAFTDEVPGMVKKYVEMNPDCGFDYKATIIATTDGAYQPALDQALAGTKDAPDMYAAESAFVLKYTQGDAANFAAKYSDMGITSADVKASNIAQYTVDIGTRGSDLVALGYQATGGAFIYRRSIAKATWGTDDPKVIKDKIGGGSGNLDTFWKAAAELKAKGYAIVSGDGDLWHAVENSSDKGWIVDGKLYIDPKREAFMDFSKKLNDNGWYNDTRDWQDAWFADMKETGTAFGFFGPAWLINYTIGQNCGGTKVGEGSYGDWAICEAPLGFFWGGTWVLGNKNSKNLAEVGKVIKWITVDYDENSLQYMWANGTFNGEGGTKDAVGSGTVMAKSNGELAFLGGQNMFDVFVPANAFANGKNLTQYDETINSYWRDAVRQFAYGEKSRADAIAGFKQNVADNLDVIVE